MEGERETPWDDPREERSRQKEQRMQRPSAGNEFGRLEERKGGQRSWSGGTVRKIA